MKRLLFTLAAALLLTLTAQAQSYLVSGYSQINSRADGQSEAETYTYIAFDDELVYIVLETGDEFEYDVERAYTCAAGHRHLVLDYDYDGSRYEELIVEEDKITYRKGEDSIVFTRLEDLTQLEE